MGIDPHIHYQYIITMANTIVMADDHYKMISSATDLVNKSK